MCKDKRIDKQYNEKNQEWPHFIWLLNLFHCTTGLKFAINRKRPFVTYPDIEKIASAGSKSFPSGHTSDAFATATSLSLAFPKWYVITPSFVWACAVGYSRMDLGVHYPSDVLQKVFFY